MPTGSPSLGFQLRGRDCLCYEWHRPRTSAQHCECHLDQMDKRFQHPVKLTPHQRILQTNSSGDKNA